MKPDFEIPFKLNIGQPSSDINKIPELNNIDNSTKELLAKHPSVIKYLSMIEDLAKIGVPKFINKISRDLRGKKSYNLIYPIKPPDLYVHIFTVAYDTRGYYIPIEPLLFEDVSAIEKELEKKFIEHISEYDVSDEKKREKIILELFDSFVSIVDKKPGMKSIISLLKHNNSHKIKLTQQQYDILKYKILKEKIGMGYLQPLIEDPFIEDITCDGVGPIFVEHKIFDSLKTAIVFKNRETLDKFVIQMSERIGKPVTFATPIIDATLPDGSRLNLVYGTDLSKKGSNFTIRKFAGTPLSVLDLIKFGTMNYEMAAYIWMLLREGMSCFVSGETASGKTTTINAITTFIRPNAKIVSIEDTPELQVPHENWTREVTRGSDKDPTSKVDMFELLKAALRQRPNEIMIGEIRGAEGNIAFQAMQTGHPVMATFHAASVPKLIQRLTSEPINVPKANIDNLNLVIIQEYIRHPTFGGIRRVTSINEIIGYDATSGSFSFLEVFSWNPVDDTFIFHGKGNSVLLEQKIARMKGIPEKKKYLIYDELKKRAKILQTFQKQGITNFYDLFNMIKKIEKKGLLF